jgi:hypothetical protein
VNINFEMLLPEFSPPRPRLAEFFDAFKPKTMLSFWKRIDVLTHQTNGQKITCTQFQVIVITVGCEIILSFADRPPTV